MKIQTLLYGLLGTILGIILTAGSIAIETDSSSEGDFLAQSQYFGSEAKFTSEQISTFKIIGAEESENNLKTHPSALFFINQPTLLKLITEKQDLNPGQLEEIDYFQRRKAWDDIARESEQKIGFPDSMYKVAHLLQFYGALLTEIATILELSEGITWKILNIIDVVRYFRSAQRRWEKMQNKLGE